MTRREDLTAARGDLAVFAVLVGHALTDQQASSLALERRQTVIVAPRQSGKSQSLAVLAAWWAFRRPSQTVLIVSAGDEAAARLLRAVRRVTDHPLLAGSVVDEQRARVVLSNGSVILSVPASERQVRGHTVDLLICDEAAFIDDDLLLGAAMPTTAARPDARVVLASSPWSDSGPFHALAVVGSQPDPFTVTFRWALRDAPWITPAVVEAARSTLSPLRFRAEYEGEFVGAADAFLSAADLLACVADYPMRSVGDDERVAVGLDWGRQVDAHAVALVGLLEDFGVNGRPVLFVPWVETSRRPYGDQVSMLEGLVRSWRIHRATSEVNGVGAYPSEELARRLPAMPLTLATSTARSKEDHFGRLRVLVEQRGIVFPREPELLRQLGGLVARGTPSGGLRIEAVSEAVHDDLPDALTLALAGVPGWLAPPRVVDPPDGVDWVQTPAGVRVPLPPRCRGSLGRPARSVSVAGMQLPPTSAAGGHQPSVGLDAYTQSARSRFLR